MQVMVDLCLIPIGVGTSLSPYIARCQTVIEQHGLNYQLHAYGTTIEGDWDSVFAAVKACHQTVHEAGAPRINSTLKVGTRTDKAQSMDDKIKSVEDKL